MGSLPWTADDVLLDTVSASLYDDDDDNDDDGRLTTLDCDKSYTQHTAIPVNWLVRNEKPAINPSSGKGKHLRIAAANNVKAQRQHTHYTPHSVSTAATQHIIHLTQS